MKQLLLLLALLLVSGYTFSQVSGTDYAFTTDVRVYKWDEATQAPLNQPEIYYRALRGAVYTIKQKVSYKKDGATVSGYRILFWKFNDKNKQNTEPKRFVDEQKEGGNRFDSVTVTVTVKVIDSTANDQMFFINEDDAKNNATADFKKPKGLFKVDGIVLPAKLRFKNSKGGTFDIGQSISVGPAINFNLNYGGAFSQTSLSFLIGANVSSIAVDEKTVPTVVTSKTTMLGLTPFTGVNFEYRGVSLGLVTGIDILSGKAEDNWVYRGCPWLGFTIGTSLISTTKKSNNSTDK